MDWCDTCQTTLATIQVEDGGLCWRCHNPVRLIQRPQWYLRISPYLQEADRRLAELAGSGIWDEVALSSQRFVLGRVDGEEIDLVDSGGETLTVFTPHGDAVALAQFVLISPRAPRTSSAGSWTRLCASSWRTYAREASSATPATPRRSRWLTPAARCPHPPTPSLCRC